MAVVLTCAVAQLDFYDFGLVDNRHGACRWADAIGDCGHGIDFKRQFQPCLKEQMRVASLDECKLECIKWYERDLRRYDGKVRDTGCTALEYNSKNPFFNCEIHGGWARPARAGTNIATGRHWLYSCMTVKMRGGDDRHWAAPSEAQTTWHGRGDGACRVSTMVPKAYDTFLGENEEQCRKVCFVAGPDKCKAYEFDSNRDKCELYSLLPNATDPSVPGTVCMVKRTSVSPPPPPPTPPPLPPPPSPPPYPPNRAPGPPPGKPPLSPPDVPPPNMPPPVVPVSSSP